MTLNLKQALLKPDQIGSAGPLSNNSLDVKKSLSPNKGGEQLIMAGGGGGPYSNLKINSQIKS
jgi:hypothetical protein